MLDGIGGINVTYFFIGFIVLAVGFAIFKVIRKRKLPSNNYTPFDDITMGKSDKD
ncbi:DUF3951 domain-containing protein [Bacillus tianshenii]|uniref:DUF3951 domain-containing protein n=1 Tax=Sutcliffiella tianshenii TaxID=1463404 RepID=UPI001EF78FC3|nr:DUF3951 domain-containing protein [Bacillus tianshenii]